jgi:hypothetical protein
MSEVKKSSGFAVASLVLGIVGLVFSWTVVGFLLCACAIVFGIFVLNNKRLNKGMAVAGVVMGSVGAFIGLIAGLVFLVGLASQTPTPKADTPVAEQPKVSQPTAPEYSVVTGNGNEAIVISHTDATEEKLILLGKKLNEVYGSKSFARVGVFTDSKYALLSTDTEAVFSLTGDESDAYDASYVAQFNVNKNTGYKQYTITLSGSSKEVNL